MNHAAESKQAKESQWHDEWEIMFAEEHQSEHLFWDWIAPLTKEDFRDKRVLDAGCGGGHMLSYIEPLIAEGVGIDLNTSDLAVRRFRGSAKVHIEEGDIATWQDPGLFDIVYSIGVVHHSENPGTSVKNLLSLVKPGGFLALWVYGYEGNALTRLLVEKPKRILFFWMPRKLLWGVSEVITVLLYPVIYTLYGVPLKSLPYYEYFQNWKRLSFRRNVANVFDKLNAPTTHFIRRSEIDLWFTDSQVREVRVSPWCGISWRVLVKK